MDYDIPKNITLISLKEKYVKRGLIDKHSEEKSGKRIRQRVQHRRAFRTKRLSVSSVGETSRKCIRRWIDTKPGSHS